MNYDGLLLTHSRKHTNTHTLSQISIIFRTRTSNLKPETYQFTKINKRGKSKDSYEFCSSGKSHNDNPKAQHKYKEIHLIYTLHVTTNPELRIITNNKKRC